MNKHPLLISCAAAMSAAVLGAVVVSAADVKPEGKWKFDASVSLRAGYDSNVYLQDRGSLAKRDSMVSTAAPRVALSYTPADQKNALLSLSYTPTFTYFHSEQDESHISNAINADLSLKMNAWTLNWNNAITIINGPDDGLVFDAPGGAPAFGGLAVRDRRDAAIYRGTLKLQYTADDWFIRPVLSGYVHDFQASHQAIPGYFNYTDRSDTSIGADVGYKVMPDTHLTLGYRLGYQSQAQVLNVPIDYSNYYHRVLLGIEGKPTRWLTVNASAGPDFREFNGDTPAGFDTTRTFLFFNASATLKPTDQDTLTLSAVQFVQPGYGGRSVYEDSCYSATWRHAMGDAAIILNAKAMRADFKRPALRDDWVYSVSPSLEYKFSKNLTGEIGYTYEVGDSQIDNTRGRDYNRHMAFVGMKYTF